MADAGVRGVLRDLSVISGKMDGLVVLPDDRFALFRIRVRLRLRWSVGLSVAALIWRRSLRRENPNGALIRPAVADKALAAETTNLTRTLSLANGAFS